MSREGILYIADAYNHVIRMVDTAGIINTVIGNGSAGFSGDGGLAKQATLNLPAALVFNTANELIIADYGNARISKVSAGPLALMLTSFDAIYNQGKVNISWQTVNGDDLAHFNVQRSKDGGGFTTLAGIPAAGNGQGKNKYEFIDGSDLTFANKVLEYRLQLVNKNGTGTFSRTRSIVLKHVPLVGVYPNPVKNQLQLQFKCSKKDAVIIQITDLQGRVLLQFTRLLYSGLNTIGLDVAALAKGSYVILINDDMTPAKKFVKL